VCPDSNESLGYITSGFFFNQLSDNFVRTIHAVKLFGRKGGKCKKVGENCLINIFMICTLHRLG
jgi:hypothetical protein